MILMTAKIIKITLLLAALVGAFVLFHKRLRTQKLIAFFVVVILSALVADMLSGYVPPLTDEVTLTALGEKNEASNGYEVVIDGFLVDGEKYPVDEVVEGQWFWRGNQYMWRPETDTRQPEGTTRTVTLKVPVGWVRTVLFSAYECRGYVEVTTSEGTETVDTSVAASAVIGRSQSSRLIFNQILGLAVYAAALMLLLAALFWCVDRVLKEPVRAKRFWEKNWFYAVLAGICAITLAALVKFCGQESFWGDELSLIYHVETSDSYLQYLLVDIAWPPLWKGIMYFWYRLVPFGEKWLMIFPELFYLPGIFFTGLLGKKLFNHRVGMLAAVLAATNGYVLKSAASDITHYSLLFSLSAIMLYLYVKWVNQEDRTWKNAIPLTVVMVLASYTHYFGFFLSGALFLIELAKYIQKRIKPKALLPYIVSWILYTPWLYYIVFIGNAAEANYWQPAPTFASVPLFLKFLVGNLQERYYLLLIGLVYLAVLFIISKTKRYTFNTSIFLLIWIPLILFSGVFLYGKFIAIGNTFWVARYFLVIAPCFIVIVGAAIDGIYMMLSGQEGRSRAIAMSLVCFFVLSSVHHCFSELKTITATSSEPFREASEWIYSHWDYMYDPDTMIITVGNRVPDEAMIQYYVTRKGKIPREDIHIADISQIDLESVLSKRRVVLLRTMSVSGGTIDNKLCEKLNESYTLTEALNDIRVFTYERNTV